MKRKNLIIILPLVFALVFSLVLSDLASAQNTDLEVSPFKGPADAPVEIAVFSCFQ